MQNLGVKMGFKRIIKGILTLHLTTSKKNKHIKFIARGMITQNNIHSVSNARWKGMNEGDRDENITPAK